MRLRRPLNRRWIGVGLFDLHCVMNEIENVHTAKQLMCEGTATHLFLVICIFAPLLSSERRRSLGFSSPLDLSVEFLLEEDGFSDLEDVSSDLLLETRGLLEAGELDDLLDVSLAADGEEDSVMDSPDF